MLINNKTKFSKPKVYDCQEDRNKNHNNQLENSVIFNTFITCRL